MQTPKIYSGVICFSILIFSLQLVNVPQVAMAESLAFPDVPSGHANYTAISALKADGVIDGYPDGTFKPDQEVNRVEVLKMIFEGLRIEDPSYTSMPDFPDVDLSSWYGNYLTKAFSLTMVEGYPDGTFKPAQTVNLVENLKLLLEAADVEFPAEVMDNPYADALSGQWYTKYVQYAKDKNLIDADSENKIHPDAGMTRADFAETLYRLRMVLNQGLETFPDETNEEPATEDHDNPETTEESATEDTVSDDITADELPPINQELIDDEYYLADEASETNDTNGNTDTDPADTAENQSATGDQNPAQDGNDPGNGIISYEVIGSPDGGEDDEVIIKIVLDGTTFSNLSGSSDLYNTFNNPGNIYNQGFPNGLYPFYPSFMSTGGMNYYCIPQPQMASSFMLSPAY